MSGAGPESLADCQKLLRRTFCSELTAVVSLLSYFFCWIMVLTAAAAAMIVVNISAAERVGHYPHPRPVVESNDREVRVVPKTSHGSPARNIEATHIHKRGAKGGTNGGY